MLEIGIIEAITLFLLSGVKLLFTPIGMIAAGKSFWTTIIITSSGGVFGALIFFFFGKKILSLFKSKKAKKVFTKQNRRTVNIKNRFGLVGMASLMGIISVPAAVIIVAKYYGKHKAVIPVLILVAIAWSFAVTSVSYLIYNLF
ncbi:MAG: hypothetical protein ACO3E1_10505 [Flavobacteriales bacterium]